MASAPRAGTGHSACRSWRYRPTQSVMYAPLKVNIFHESILLIIQYKYLKSCSGDFYSPESDPPHKIMRYWLYYSIWLGFSFPPDLVLWKWYVPQLNQFRRGISGGPALKSFYMIHRGGRLVFNVVKSPGQSFHEWHFLDQIAPSF